MPLDNYGRGLLEKSIDETIPVIPTFVERLRNNMPEDFMIQKMEDYAFGFVKGLIIGNFLGTYGSTYFPNPPPDLMNEIGDVMVRRARDIREAIFKAG
jgi:hypothetical protein